MVSLRNGLTAPPVSAILSARAQGKLMAVTRFLKPARGLLVRLEDTSRHLFQEGENIIMSAYWRRRLRDGDVTEAKPPKPAKES